MTLVNAILSSTLKVNIVFFIIHSIVVHQFLLNDVHLNVESKQFGFHCLHILFLEDQNDHHYNVKPKDNDFNVDPALCSWSFQI